jgi:type IV pilus assembly protein PilX
MELELTMTSHRNRSCGFSGAPRRQRGTMLIIALIVLVAMTLVGIATMRSVDTASLVAGNIAFKQSTIGGADAGLKAGYDYLTANALGNVLLTDHPNDGYLSSISPNQKEPDWSLSSSWTTEKKLNSGNPDAAGNVVSFLIHRMCPVPNCAPNDKCLGQDNPCGSTPDARSVSGEGIDQSKPNYIVRPDQIHYRITARALGPRNSVTVVQTMVRIQ